MVQITKLDQDLIDEIASYYRRGANARQAAALSHTSVSTLRAWIADGRVSRKDSWNNKLVVAIEEAKAEASDEINDVLWGMLRRRTLETSRNPISDRDLLMVIKELKAVVPTRPDDDAEMVIQLDSASSPIRIEIVDPTDDLPDGSRKPL